MANGHRTTGVSPTLVEQTAARVAGVASDGWDGDPAHPLRMDRRGSIADAAQNALPGLDVACAGRGRPRTPVYVPRRGTVLA